MEPKIEPKYIWVIYEECHGIVGYWDTREGAVAEVERLNKSTDWYENDPLCYNDEYRYGYEWTNARRVELNKPW